MIYGEKVRLKPIEKEDLSQLARWRNQPEVRYRTREWRLLSQSGQGAWFESLLKDKNQVLFIIQIKEVAGLTGPIIGVAGLCYINWRDRTAELSIYIGEKTEQGKGLGHDIMECVLGYGFVDLGLHRIWLEVYSFNEHGIKLFDRTGFKEEGRLRDNVYRLGERHDSIIMGMLQREYSHPRKDKYINRQGMSTEVESKTTIGALGFRSGADSAPIKVSA